MITPKHSTTTTWLLWTFHRVWSSFVFMVFVSMFRCHGYWYALRCVGTRRWEIWVCPDEVVRVSLLTRLASYVKNSRDPLSTQVSWDQGRNVTTQALNHYFDQQEERHEEIRSYPSRPSFFFQFSWVELVFINTFKIMVKLMVRLFGFCS